MNVIKKGKDLYFGVDWRSMCMCDVMCNVLSQPSTFQFFDAKAGSLPCGKCGNSLMRGFPQKRFHTFFILYCL